MNPELGLTEEMPFHSCKKYAVARNKMDSGSPNGMYFLFSDLMNVGIGHVSRLVQIVADASRFSQPGARDHSTLITEHCWLVWPGPARLDRLQAMQASWHAGKGTGREKALTPTSLTHSVLVTVGHSVAYWRLPGFNLRDLSGLLDSHNFCI